MQNEETRGRANGALSVCVATNLLNSDHHLRPIVDQIIATSPDDEAELRELFEEWVSDEMLPQGLSFDDLLAELEREGIISRTADDNEAVQFSTSRRELRGFNVRLVDVCLYRLRNPEIRSTLEEAGGKARGNKDQLVGRLRRLIVSGRISWTDAWEFASKQSLQAACRELDVPERGSRKTLTRRLRRCVRWAPLAASPSLPSEMGCELDPGLSEREQLFLLELHSRLQKRSRGATKISLGELVARLGRFRGDYRVRLSAAHHTGQMLWGHRIATDPDLRNVDTSPGVDSTIVLSIHDEQLDQQIDGQADDIDREASGRTQPTAIDARLHAVELIAKLAMAVAQSDRVVAKVEVEELRRRAFDNAEKLSAANKDRMDEILNGLESQEILVEDIARQLASDLDSEQKSELMDHLFDVAVADGVFAPGEAELLEKLHRALDTDTHQYERLLRLCRAVPESESEVEPRENIEADIPARTPVAKPKEVIDDILSLLMPR